jgi:hypothetical protein
METNYNCKYCDSNFKRRDILNKHQNNAKYCLNIQRQEKEREREREREYKYEPLKVELEKTKRECEKLKIELENTKKERERECEKLKIELENIKKERERECDKLKIQLENTKRLLEDMKEDRDDYKDKIFSLANNPINTSNNNYTALTNTNTHTGNNNVLMLTPFDMNEKKFSDVIKDSFTKDYMIQGQKGVAKFAVDKLLKDEEGKLQYVCTDPSRQIYKFKTIEGGVERDVKAQKLTKNIIDEIKRKSQSMVVDDMNSEADVFMMITNNFQDINGMESDNSDFRNALASLTVC